MFEEEILVALLVTIFALCLHYYIGTIDLWYMPAVEICIALIFYELTKAMYNSYKTFDNHARVQQQARQDEISLLTDINTLKNKNIETTTTNTHPIQNKDHSKSITFEEIKKIRHFRNDEDVLDKVEVTTGTEEVMSDIMSDTEENV
jgi:hypothetical protein